MIPFEIVLSFVAALCFWVFCLQRRKQIDRSIDNVCQRLCCLETSVKDHENEMEMRASSVEERILSQVRKDIEAVTEILDRRLEADGDKLLRDAHRAIWNDMDGTLTTMREDFDASLNARTTMLQDRIAKIQDRDRARDPIPPEPSQADQILSSIKSVLVDAVLKNGKLNLQGAIKDMLRK